MNEAEILELLHTLEALGIPTSPVGILRARMRGILTPREVTAIFDWAYGTGQLEPGWWRVLVWSAPR